MKQLILIMAVALLSACNMAEGEHTEEFLVEEQVSAVAAEYAYAYENASPLQLFFKEDQTKATFHESNENGDSFTEETFWLSEDYVKTIVVKQGVATYSIYRITKDAIEIMYEGETDLKVTTADLQQMTVKRSFLTFPIEIGTSLEGWTVTNVNQQIETPFETFHEVVELTQKIEGQIIRRYFASGFGLVKETISIDTDQGAAETSFLLDALEY